MAFVLRIGLVLSLALLAVGVVLYVWLNPRETFAGVLSNNPILSYLSFPALASGLAGESVSALLTLGLIVLVATPVMRVASGLYSFGKVGDRAMTGIAFAVLALLLLGVLVIGPLVR
jgi:uncharacterized membrane protein